MELIQYFKDYGTELTLVVLLILGILVPKYVVDEYRTREKVKDAFIEKLGNAVERLADKIEAQK